MMNANFRSFRKESLNNDDGNFTFTSTEQKRVEELVSKQFEALSEDLENTVNSEECPYDVLILRQRHADFLLRSLKNVSKNYTSLDASRTWMCFWAVHALNVLGIAIPKDLKTRVIKFLKTCEHAGGGYGGGPGQNAHLAPTYAAVMCLTSLQTDESLNSIDKKKLLSFLKRMKQRNGSFTMHDSGEADMRSAYCSISVAAILGMPLDDLVQGTAEWIMSCQSYEGGFGGEPMTEAHGGYAFCAVASLVLLNRFRLVDVDMLLRWLVRRQMKFEGGFQGRTNKLVDGCYSFWQGAIFPLIEGEMEREGKAFKKGLFDARMLEEYILIACQAHHGGFRDKPDKGVDLYHTCYVLSGLSIAQGYSVQRDGNVLGGDVNRLNEVHPVFNVTLTSEQFAAKYFCDNAYKEK